MLTASPKAKGEAVKVGNTKEAAILELAKKSKDATKRKSTIKFHPMPKDEAKRRCPDTAKG